jgi:tetratricopeptide (TPR) repeat protein
MKLCILVCALTLGALARAEVPEAVRLYQEGLAKQQAGDYRGALGRYGDSLRLDRKQAPVYQSIGDCYVALGQKERALPYFKYSLFLNPANAALAATLAPPTASAAPAPAAQTAPQGGDWFQPLWRSAILPGWGQAYNGQAGKGYFLGGANLALLVGEVASFMVGDAAKQQYLGVQTGGDFDTPYNTWSNMAAVNHLCFWGMGAAYAFNLVDAVMNSGRPKLAAAAEQDLEVALVPGGFRARLHVFEF